MNKIKFHLNFHKYAKRPKMNVQLSAQQSVTKAEKEERTGVIIGRPYQERTSRLGHREIALTPAGR